MKKFLFISILFCLAGSTLLSCAESSDGSTTPIRKGGPGGGGSTKPQDQMIQKALNDKVLFLLQKNSSLQAAQADAVSVLSKFKLNNQESFAWRIVSAIKSGEVLNRKEGVEVGFDDPDYSISVFGKRFTRTASKDVKANLEKTDLGLLVLVFELKRKVATNEVKSQQIVALDLNRVNRPEAFVLIEFQYPVPQDFSLDRWIQEKLLKSSVVK